MTERSPAASKLQSTLDPDSSFDDPRVTEALKEFLASVEAGEALSQNELLERYPDVAEQLTECLEGLELIRAVSPDVGSPIGNAAEPVTAANEEIRSKTAIGDYRIVREVGRGGMGVVYEAEQTSLGRRVALKVLPFASTMDPRHLQRFQNEARAAASLEHPHIVPVYGVGCERGVHYYAMKLIDGQSLAQVIGDRKHRATAKKPPTDLPQAPPSLNATKDYAGPIHHGEPAAAAETIDSAVAKKSTQLSATGRAYFEQVARLGIQAAEALEHAHQLGIVHRDVKPGNLMLDASGHLWVTDFGLAQLEAGGGLTMTGDLLGTLRYMSPEQAAGQRVLNHSTDVYSLGVTLYELLTLQPAFPGEDRRRLLREIPEVEPRAPRSLSSTVPADLETIVLKAMAKEPKDRYVTAQELAGDLRRFLNHEPVRAKRPTSLQKMSRLARRNRGLLTVVLLVAVALLAGTAVSVWQAIRARNAERLAETRAGRERKARKEADAARDRATQSALRARHLLYAGDVRLAGEAWRNNDVARMRELLAGHVPKPGETDFRGFAWHFLWKQTGIASEELARGDSPVHYACFSPDGRVLATAGADAVIRLFDGRTFAPAGSILSGQGEVNGLAFTPDSRTLASAGDDGNLVLWDVTTRQEKHRFRAHAKRAYQVAFGPDGKVLASCGSDPIVRLWDPASGRSLGELEDHVRAVEAIAVSPRGILAAASRDGRTSIWDLKTQAKIRHIENGNRGPVFAVAFSPKGDRLVQGQNGGLLTLIAVGDELAVTGRQVVRDGVQSLAFAPRGDWLAVGDRAGGVYLLPADLSNQESGLAPAAAGKGRLFQWQAHRGRTYALTFTPDGRRLVSGGQDGREILWDLGKRSTEHRIPGKAIAQFAFLDNHRLALAMPGVPVHDLRTGTLRRRAGHDTPSGSRIARAGRAGRLFAADPFRGVLAHDEDGGSWAPVWTPPARCFAEDMTVSPDGRFLAVRVGIGPGKSYLKLFDLKSQRSVAHFAASSVERARFSPDSRHVAFTFGKDVRIAETASGKVIQTLQGHLTSVKDLAFSPDGRHFASVSDDRTLRVWDWRAGLERWSVLAHQNRAAAVAFAPDGRTIVTAGRDNVLRFWRWQVERLAFELRMDLRSVHQVAFSPDGRRLACCRPMDGIVVYDAAEPTNDGGTTLP